MARYLIYFGLFLVINIYFCSAEISKRPSWAVGRSVDGSEEYNDANENNSENDEWLSSYVEKKPSWVVGRDLISNQKNYMKRIIEFKRNLNDHFGIIEKYENELDELKKLIFQQVHKEKKGPFLKKIKVN